MGNRENVPSERTQSLPASSHESSTEPMDTDDARRASEEIYQRIRQQAGLSRSSSVGDMTLRPEPIGVMTQGRLILHRGTPEQTQVAQASARDQPFRTTESTMGAVGGTSLLNIPPCSMAEEPGEQSQSLFRPPMSDPKLDLECQLGARPKVAGPLTTQTIQEEAEAAPTEEHALQVRGTDFYLPLGGQPRISERKSWRAPIVTEQGNPGIYIQIDEWLPLYKGNVYVLDEITGRMYLSKGEHLMWIAETGSHRPFQDHELSISQHVPEKEYLDPQGQPVWGQWKADSDRKRGSNIEPLTPIPGTTGGMGRTLVSVAESNRQSSGGVLGETPVREGPGHGDISAEPGRDQGELAVGTQDVQGEERPEWALPEPSEPRRPPGEDASGAGVPPHVTEGQEGEPITH